MSAENDLSGNQMSALNDFLSLVASATCSSGTGLRQRIIPSSRVQLAKENEYLAVQQLHAARRKLEVSTLAWERAKESFQLAKENV